MQNEKTTKDKQKTKKLKQTTSSIYEIVANLKWFEMCHGLFLHRIAQPSTYQLDSEMLIDLNEGFFIAFLVSSTFVVIVVIIQHFAYSSQAVRAKAGDYCRRGPEWHLRKSLEIKLEFALWANRAGNSCDPSLLRLLLLLLLRRLFFSLLFFNDSICRQ